MSTLTEMSDAELFKEWNRQCRRHDRAVDREEMNSPTIEAAAACMDSIETIIKKRHPGENIWAMLVDEP